MPKKKKKTSLGPRRKYYYRVKTADDGKKFVCLEKFETCEEAILNKPQRKYYYCVKSTDNGKTFTRLENFKTHKEAEPFGNHSSASDNDNGCGILKQESEIFDAQRTELDTECNDADALPVPSEGQDHSYAIQESESSQHHSSDVKEKSNSESSYTVQESEPFQHQTSDIREESIGASAYTVQEPEPFQHHSLDIIHGEKNSASGYAIQEPEPFQHQSTDIREEIISASGYAVQEPEPFQHQSSDIPVREEIINTCGCAVQEADISVSSCPNQEPESSQHHTSDTREKRVSAPGCLIYDKKTKKYYNVQLTDLDADSGHGYALPSTGHGRAVSSSTAEITNGWFKKLQGEVKNMLLSPYISLVNEDVIEILEMYQKEGETSVKLSILIDKNACAKIFVHRREVSKDHHLWSGLPKKFDSKAKIVALLTRLKNFGVCKGNPDEEFQDLGPIGTTLSCASTSKIYAFREGDFCAQLGDQTNYHSTIRSVHCALLVDGRQCGKCAEYRRFLWGRKRRMEEKSNYCSSNLVSSTYKHKYMNRDMLIAKIKQQQKCISNLQHEVERQRREIKQQNSRASAVMLECPNRENIHKHK